MKWSTVPIGQVCLETAQRDPRTAPSRSIRYVDLSAIDRESKSIVTSAEIQGIDAPSRARKEIRTEDVLVSTVRPNLNAVAIVPEELDGELASTGFCVLRADRRHVHPRFLFYRVQCDDFVRFLVQRVSGANYPAVSDSIVKDSPVPLPPLAEQERIVRILDEAEELLKLRVEADRRTADLIPALFHDMFGDPATNLKRWQVIRMSDLFEIRPNYGTMIPPKNEERKWLDIRVANIQNGMLDLSDRKYVDLPDDMIPRHTVKDGDLLLARAIGSLEHLGKCIIVYPDEAKWSFDSHLMRVRLLKDRALPEMVHGFLTSASGRRSFLNMTRNSAVQFNINTKEFGSISLPLPPLSLQREFAARVAGVRTMEAQQAESRHRLDDLFHSLLHRAFSGEL